MKHPSLAAKNMGEKYVPIDPNPEEPTLLWKLEQMREMFLKHKMWPSFIGAKVELTNSHHQAHGSSKAAVGLLPIVLWPEQEALLKENGYDITKSKGLQEGETVPIAGTKRKREDNASDEEDKQDVSEDDSDEEEDNSNSSHNTTPRKKARRGESSGNDAIGVFAYMWSAVTAPFHYIFGLSNSEESKRLTKAELQMTIFRKCYELGYFIGPGDVYGGDYNIYRGDPSNSHSTATIKVCRRRTITGRDLLSFSRVQNNVAKSAVLAFVDHDSLDKEPGFLVVNFRNVSERV